MKLLFKTMVNSTAVVLPCLLMGVCSPPQVHQEIFSDTFTLQSEVFLAPGDVIDVKFSYTPELNESQTVRPDGKISLQLLGDVRVAGKTPDQIRNELIAAYRPNLNKPDLVVILRTMNERRVYVGGEVTRPGVIQLPGSLSVLEAIMEAGGFTTATAQPKNVVIIRRHEDKWVGKVVNLSKSLKGVEAALCELQPRDIVWVPKTAIANVDQWVDQYINKVIPTFVNHAADNYYIGQWLFNQVNK